MSNLIQYTRPSSSINLLAKDKAKRKQVSQVRYLSEDNFIGLYGRQIWLLRTTDRIHSDGLISLGKHDFTELLNILLITLLVARSVLARVQKLFRADL